MQDSTRHLLNFINSGNIIAVSKSIQPFLDRGAVKWGNVLAIPLKSRLPHLTHVYGTDTIHKLLTALLTQFCNSFNLVRPMNEDQIVSCAYQMLLTSEEDLLSMEDFTLFFEGAKLAKYGRVLDHLDQQVVFEMFEQYREQRHQYYNNAKAEKQAQYKTSATALGRSCDDNATEVQSIREAMNDYYKKTVIAEHEKK